MPNEIKISIIVPVYKVEGYLRKSIESMLNQTLKDIEIILVDDGSPDNCPKIIDEYQEKYPDIIKAVHKENGGQGDARNLGINIAKGRYILFVDSDDYIENNMAELLYNEANDNDADIVVCGYKIVFEDGKLKDIATEKLPENTDITLQNNKTLLHTSAAPWNKLVKREILLDKEMQFPIKVWYEDIRATTKWSAKAKKIRYINKPLYNYVIREGSTVNNKNAERNKEIITAFEDILGYFKEKNLFEEYKDELEFLTVFHILLTASVRVIMIDKKSKLLNEFREYTDNNFPNWQENKYLCGLDKNKELILKLIKKKHYGTIKTIFNVKNRLKK